MKKNTIKWKILKYNLIVIIMLVVSTTIIFNIAVRIYIERDIMGQLSRIALQTEDTALRKRPDFFPPPRELPPHPEAENENELIRYYWTLDRSLREPLSVLNADYILLDKEQNIITPFPEEFFLSSSEILEQISTEINALKKTPQEESYVNFNLSGTKYIAMIKPVAQKNSFGLGWIIIYSSLEKINQLQLGINIILLIILILSALVIVVFASEVSKKISAPFSSLNEHIRAIAERKFGNKIHMPVDDELQEFVNNINIMSEKLETHDKAQKTFLQNISHEFRTPLMSIQSYAEGIKYKVVDNNTAVDIIVDESKRMSTLVEDLLYLSRLDTIEENYNFNDLDFSELIKSCIERMNGIAIKNNIKISIAELEENMEVYADEEKLSRAITNILNNCIKYADSTVAVTAKLIDNKHLELIISDDGPGFEHDDLNNIFQRFYKGKKGNFGLGLAISKNVIEKHNGRISAENSPSGALFRVKLPVNQV
jgi:signal transduction histidine kinase